MSQLLITQVNRIQILLGPFGSGPTVIPVSLLISILGTSKTILHFHCNQKGETLLVGRDSKCYGKYASCTLVILFLSFKCTWKESPTEGPTRNILGDSWGIGVSNTLRLVEGTTAILSSRRTNIRYRFMDVDTYCSTTNFPQSSEKVEEALKLNWSVAHPLELLLSTVSTET